MYKALLVGTVTIHQGHPLLFDRNVCEIDLSKTLILLVKGVKRMSYTAYQ